MTQMQIQMRIRTRNTGRIGRTTIVPTVTSLCILLSTGSPCLPLLCPSKGSMGPTSYLC